MEEGLRSDESYEKIMDIYIESSVAAEDRIRMHQMMDFEKICQRLTRIPQLMVHYRVRRSNGRIEYFYVKCARVGTAEDFQAVVFALPMRIWMYGTVRWRPYWNQEEQHPEENFLL